VTAPAQGLAQALRDRYTLERELGRGGMATVYLAHDLKHDRPVALKVLHAELASSLGPGRFLREIRTTARLQHPHILPVLDSGEAAGELWYTMPYVRGESLRDLLRRDVQLPIESAVDLARQIALALDYAHREGVIHRDLKPENILLSDQQALVADFGVAKALAAGHEGQLTETGISVGTPAYMSPEQASADHVDGRSDVYALGCVVYEMLAGEPPFTGRTPQALLAKRALDPVPHVRTVRESVPEPLEQAITRALAKAPADRFQTAADFARALALSEVSLPRASAPAAVPAINAVATAPTPSMPIRGRRVPLVVTALGLGLLLALGLVVAWLRSRPDPTAGNPKRLAVLPFENLGRPEDGYFADGVTDEVRGKLAALPGLEVIARTSSVQYKETTKSPRQIGQELGVDYLLTGTVRWDKDAGGPSRVRVSPELVQVSTASTTWQQPFDAALTDVFQVQADVAARVAEGLGVALKAGERERLSERPTENLAAYDAFLRGEQAAEGTAIDIAALTRARQYYERAVALDSGFALAWAQLSRAHSNLYWNAPSPAAAAAARRAAERAVALAPKRPEGYLALGNYYEVVRYDPSRALEQYTKGRQLAPKDAWLLAWAGWGEFLLGRFDEGLEHMREAEVLDPRSVDIARSLTWPLLTRRRYVEALATAERALRLSPSNLSVIATVVSVHLARGDLAGARAVLRAVPREVDPAELVAHIAMVDLYWVLDDAQQRLLLRLSPEPFGGNRAAWGLALAETHALRGDADVARAYADSARLAYEARLRDVPQDAPTRTYLGLALAYLGRRAEAVREGERGVALMPISRNALLGAELQRVLAWTYSLMGEPEKAVDRLEPLLKLPFYVSPAWLRIDPSFAQLRGNPRFERLVAGK
jgi:TolB-like protein/tetratricopeptide (TPR) repeat protein